MYKKTSPLFLICETPLHAGSGDDLGIVDLPIQRERHTSFPKIESSSLKGALREAFESQSDKKEAFKTDIVKQIQFNQEIHRVFGYDSAFEKQMKKDEEIEKIQNSNERNKQHLLRKVKDFFTDNTEFAGCLAVTDARLLLFPIKSMKGVFVWVTCPQVLNRLATDLKIADKKPFAMLDAVKKLEITEGSCLIVDKSKVAFGENVILEEYAFSAKEDSAVKTLAAELADTIFKADDLQYWNATLKTNLVVLNNNDFRDFVNLSTEVVTRIKIDNSTGTVESGALFTEEYLPNDSVMYSLIMFSDEFSKKEDAQKMKSTDVQAFFKENLKDMFQLGGNATIGKGLLRTELLND